ncbi:hypothetical protein [Spirosoma sp. KNUC1025]|uniref:hypothetical protein n=1 Tax=Spirosoma sp. KNUC1025 TaxID=2894082 RepID=UPI00386D6FB4|nr:hypothetical protein LN737_19420 [Spirosoma sp. KNUC1025]
MNKRSVFVPIVAMLALPSLFRSVFATLYNTLHQYHPIGGFVLMVILDILWMWVALVIVILASRAMRRMLKQKVKSEHNGTSSEHEPISVQQLNP